MAINGGSAGIGGRCRVRDLLNVTGPVDLRLAGGSRDNAVTRTALFDPTAPLRPAPFAVLIGVGLTPRLVDVAAVLAEAAAAGHTALVLRASALVEAPELAGLADDHRVALLTVGDGVDWLGVEAQVRAAILAAAHRDGAPPVGDLFSLAEAISDSVGGAVVIEDVNLRVLAYSSGEYPIDENRRNAILGRRVPFAPENPGQYRQVYQSSTVCEVPAVGGDLDRLGVALRSGDEVIGSLWVTVPANGLNPGASRHLADVAPLVAAHLMRARQTEDLARQQRSEAAAELVAGSGDLRDAAAVLGFSPGAPMAAMTIAAVSPAQRLIARQQRFAALVELNCQSRKLAVGVTGASDLVHVVCSAKRLADSQDLVVTAEAIRRSARTALELDVVIGVGPVAATAAGLRSSAQSSAKVATLLRREPELAPIATHRQLTDRTSFADLAAAAAETPGLVSARVDEIRSHDEGFGTGYAELLRVYLRNWRDATRTAAELGVHPNTVRYRLRRISETFGVELADPDQMLPIWLGLEVRRLDQDRVR